MINIEQIVRENLCKSLRLPTEEAAKINLDHDLVFEFGLASLDKIVLMTSVCTEVDVALTEFDEDDLAKLQTPRGIINVLQSKRFS